MAAEAADSNMLITGQQSSALCVLVMCSDSKAMWNWKLTAVHVNLNLLRGKRQVENSLWLRCYRVIMNLLAPSDEVRQLISINADFNRRPSRSVFTSPTSQTSTVSVQPRNILISTPTQMNELHMNIPFLWQDGQAAFHWAYCKTTNIMKVCVTVNNYSRFDQRSYFFSFHFPSLNSCYHSLLLLSKELIWHHE